jgi:acid phosphatase family membrane protein YuiD
MFYLYCTLFGLILPISSWSVFSLYSSLKFVVHIFGYDLWRQPLFPQFFFILCMYNSQVLRVVKTRQATYVVLNHLLEYVQDLEKSGILEKKEMLHLHDAVQVSCGLIFFLS